MSDGVGDGTCELPGGIHGWFHEGLATVDLVEAKALLKDLE
jgi:hypothetical protein